MANTTLNTRKNIKLKPGQEIKIKSAKSARSEVPPWNGDTYEIRITKEYPYLYDAILLPCNKGRYHIKYPQKISINKIDIYTGEVQILTT